MRQKSADKDTESPGSSVSCLSDRQTTDCVFSKIPDRIRTAEAVCQTDTGHDFRKIRTKRDKERIRTVLSADVCLRPEYIVFGFSGLIYQKSMHFFPKVQLRCLRSSSQTISGSLLVIIVNNDSVIVNNV